MMAALSNAATAACGSGLGGRSSLRAMGCSRGAGARGRAGGGPGSGSLAFRRVATGMMLINGLGRRRFRSATVAQRKRVINQVGATLLGWLFERRD